MTLRGFGRLQTPRDLLQKLRHEHALVEQNPSSEYIAFNFLVTAYHMLDWLHPGLRQRSPAAAAERDRLESAHLLLQIAWQLANGVKHFKVQAKKHQSSVTHVRVEEGAWDDDAVDPTAFDTDELVVELENAAAAQFGASICVVPLATKMLEFWEEYFRQNVPL